MCESCNGFDLNRRGFLAASSMLGAAGLLSTALADDGQPVAKKEKLPARVRVVFLYPPVDVVNEGKFEDAWQSKQWFTWPGNQFQPEQQEQVFRTKIAEAAARVGVTVDFAPKALYQQAAYQEFIEKAKADKPDAVLVVNFWNTLAATALKIATESAPMAIVYQPVGSSHQLPNEGLRKAEGVYFIHSIENWDEIERGLRAVQAKKMMAQSRLLRVSGQIQEPASSREELLGLDILSIPAVEFNATFDAIKPDDALARDAMEFKKNAAGVMDVTDEYFVEAFRAYRTIGQLLERHGADAITIECLFLQHRKPCVAFALNNGNLIPSGCENDLNATLTLMLGRWLLERGGFQHNPDFDTSDNRYFASHCTCTPKLHGPDAPPQQYLTRPFFHQLPKSVALDVQWTPGDPVVLAKYHTEKKSLTCWTGKALGSPTSPPVGGCATRVLVEIDGTQDVCEVYPGPHPVLFAADRGKARQLKAFAKLARLSFKGNV